MKNILYIVFIFFGFTISDSKFTLVKSIPVSSKNFTTDNLGNIYIINGSNLEKYDSEGNLLKTYSNKNLGNISSVDVTNSLKVLVFYESFQQIVVLDNMFSPSANPVSLEMLGYNQTSLVCTSHNNGIWIYNKQNFELIRFDENFQQTNKTENITRQIMQEVNPDFLIEQNNKVFLNDSAKGIFVFDIYGTYNKTIPLKGIGSFQISNDEIIYFKDGKLKSYNIKTLSEGEINLPTTEILYARSEKEKLYLLKQKSLDIYHVQNEK
ncbi:MAG: hypothetical protein HY063_11150 [Bacteroidetes bacterium]|nr:hypothetical protein [Bacteroidota bacterium]